VVAYIIRRVFAAILLLFVISLATFAIFFLVPRLAGATPQDLASRYVGKTANQEQIAVMTQKLGFDDPIIVQYGRFVKGLFVGADYSTGPTTEHCPAPCFGYSFITQNPVWPDLVDRLGRDALVGRGGGHHLAGRRRSRSVCCRPCARAASSTGPRWAWRWPGSRCPSSSPDCCRCPSSRTPALVPARRQLHARSPRTRACGRTTSTLPWITLAFLYAAGYARLTRGRMLETMNEDYIRPARAKGLPERTWWSNTACGRRDARS
jgi:peptide/nickel transport system permease protein